MKRNVETLRSFPRTHLYVCVCVYACMRVCLCVRGCEIDVANMVLLCEGPDTPRQEIPSYISEGVNVCVCV